MRFVFLCLVLTLVGCASPYGVESRVPRDAAELTMEEKIAIARQRDRMLHRGP